MSRSESGSPCESWEDEKLGRTQPFAPTDNNNRAIDHCNNRNNHTVGCDESSEMRFSDIMHKTVTLVSSNRNRYTGRVVSIDWQVKILQLEDVWMYNADGWSAGYEWKLRFYINYIKALYLGDIVTTRYPQKPTGFEVVNYESGKCSLVNKDSKKVATAPTKSKVESDAGKETDKRSENKTNPIKNVNRRFSNTVVRKRSSFNMRNNETFGTTDPMIFQLSSPAKNNDGRYKRNEYYRNPYVNQQYGAQGIERSSVYVGRNNMNKINHNNNQQLTRSLSFNNGGYYTRGFVNRQNSFAGSTTQNNPGANRNTNSFKEMRPSVNYPRSSFHYNKARQPTNSWYDNSYAGWYDRSNESAPYRREYLDNNVYNRHVHFDNKSLPTKYDKYSKPGMHNFWGRPHYYNDGWSRDYRGGYENNYYQRNGAYPTRRRSSTTFPSTLPYNNRVNSNKKGLSDKDFDFEKAHQRFLNLKNKEQNLDDSSQDKRDNEERTKSEAKEDTSIANIDCAFGKDDDFFDHFVIPDEKENVDRRWKDSKINVQTFGKQAIKTSRVFYYHYSNRSP